MREEQFAVWMKASNPPDEKTLHEFWSAYHQVALTDEDVLLLGCPLVSGWYLIQLSMYETELFNDSKCLRKLSMDGEVVFCSVHEGVNFVSASLWSKGKEVWHVEHSLSLGRNHLESRGNTPENLPDIVEQLIVERTNTPEERRYDNFSSAPLLLAKQLTGWKHSYTLKLDGEVDYLKFQPNHPRTAPKAASSTPT